MSHSHRPITVAIPCRLQLASKRRIAPLDLMINFPILRRIRCHKQRNNFKFGNLLFSVGPATWLPLRNHDLLLPPCVACFAAVLDYAHEQPHNPHLLLPRWNSRSDMMNLSVATENLFLGMSYF
ncbi:hypothetical protein BC830DRAFT_345171 [Chytriomyces sp. MP71]|nr:hypothetical protein BC830DRAFT_345171 [Chytriomyces sp. MP71]